MKSATRTQSKILRAADLFCGAGGTSSALLDACSERGQPCDMVAVNHWPIAIETHSANHPQVRHYCEDIHNLDPRKAVPGGHLDFLWASFECIFFSRARGGKPINDQQRATPWQILRWLELLRVDVIAFENVPEIVDWAPLGVDGKPLKSRKGEVFEAFLSAIRALNYTVDWRILNCAYYGDPTTRQRWFLIGKRGHHKKIAWPEPTHRPPADLKDLFGSKVKPWRTAREIINWQHKGKSIYARKKPLSPNTMRRIWAGLVKFGGAAFYIPISNLKSQISNPPLVEPFLIKLRGTEPGQLDGANQSVDTPLPAITSGGGHLGLIEPFLIKLAANGSTVQRFNRRRDRAVPSERYPRQRDQLPRP